jgi:Helicase conserved C-terminal domain
MCDSQLDAEDVDNFQKFQPGFRIEWLNNLKGGSETHTQSTTTTDQHEVLNDGAPIIRPSTEARKTKKFGDGHRCEYDWFSVSGRCIYCHTEHEDCNLINAKGRCKVCHRCSLECPKSESKSYFLVERLLALLKEPKQAVLGIREFQFKQEPRPLKAIVFSQFRDVLNVVGDRLLKKFGTACVAEYFGRYREQELHKFVHSNDCFVLLLTKDGSEGLDLSFVTNIVFLEQIYDKSLQNQTVARAWRIGATGPVEVETLIASNTVEETMYKQSLNQYSMERMMVSHDQIRTADNDARRLESLLRSLRLNTDYHHFCDSQTTLDDQKARIGKANHDHFSCETSYETSGKNIRRVHFQLEPHGNTSNTSTVNVE